MNINKSALLSALKSDLKAAEVLKNNTDAKIKQWRDEYDGRPYGNEVAGKSAIVSRDIKKQSEWQHASILEPFVSSNNIVKVFPVTAEDKASAVQNEVLLNTQFCRRFPRYNFMAKSIKVLDQEGTLVVQTGWDYEGVTVTQLVDTVVMNEYGIQEIVQVEAETVEVIRNNPTAKVCRNEDIYMDPTCQDDIDNAQFFIHRYETDLSTLRKDDRYSNLDKLAGGSSNFDGDYESPDVTDFKFTDDPRKKLLVYEYWGNYDLDGDGIAEPIVCAWVDSTIIRLSDNPYPDKKPPFLVVPFNSIPFKAHGEPNAELISNNQKVKTAILRGIIDNMAKSNNAQVGVKKGALDPTNKTRFLDGKSFEYNNSQNDFWQGSYNPLPGSVFDMLGLMSNEIESLTGTISGGSTSSHLGGSATAARGALDAASVRRMNIVRNIAENLIKPLFRKWIAYNAEFLGEEEVIRVTNEEYVTVRKDDLAGTIDLDIDVSTAEDNAAKAQELSFLLQTVGPNEDPGVRRELMATLLDLMRMPDSAKKMREFEPQPDPVMEEVQALEVARLQKENFLLDAKIADLQVRQGKLLAETGLTEAKTGTEQARAVDIASNTDLKDLEFLRKDEGVEEQLKLALFERKRLHDMDLVAYQARLGDNNLGIPR